VINPWRRCLRVRSGRQGARLELTSESQSLSRLSGFAPYNSLSLKNQNHLPGSSDSVRQKTRPNGVKLGAVNLLRPIVEPASGIWPRRRELHLVRFEALDGACLSLHGRSQRQPYRRFEVTASARAFTKAPVSRRDRACPAQLTADASVKKINSNLEEKFRRRDNIAR
jgi:hypothetical protein